MLKLNDPSISGPELEREAKEAILRILASVPGASIEVVAEPPREAHERVQQLLEALEPRLEQ